MHFETLAPICPLCLAQRNQSHLLVLASVIRETSERIDEGTLHCSNPACQCEYPIIDGIPILVPDIRTFIANHMQSITSRHDLSHEMESLIGDCAGPGSTFDNTRLHLSIYTHSHYGDFDDGESKRECSSLVDLLGHGWEQIAELPRGPILDAACSVGRTALELAKRNPDQLIIGVDLDFRMLQTAQRILRDGMVKYARRKVGLVYEQRAFETPFAEQTNADFWLCDVTQLPFANESFVSVVGLNVLDCVTSPLQFLHQVDRTIQKHGWFLLSSPYDWSPAATPPDAWIGGHSQRGPDSGSSEAILERLLTPGAHPQSVRRLQLQKTIDRLPWRVRLHDRFTAEYMVQVMLAKAK